jgi:hypothetical protein
MKPYRGKEKAPGLLKSNANHPLTNTPIAHDRGAYTLCRAMGIMCLKG